MIRKLDCRLHPSHPPPHLYAQWEVCTRPVQTHIDLDSEVHQCLWYSSSSLYRDGPTDPSVGFPPKVTNNTSSLLSQRVEGRACSR